MKLPLITYLLIVLTTSSRLEAQPADWPLFRGTPESTGVAAQPLPDQLELLWEFSIEDGGFAGTAAIVDGKVYVGDLDGNLYALELANGNKLWKYETGLGFSASPSITEGRVYIGDIDGVFYCLDGKTGNLVWKYTAGLEINSCANFYNDSVLFGSQDATLYCLNAATGKETWKFTIDDQIRCSPTVVQSRCFLAGCDARLHVVNLAKGEKESHVAIDGPTGVTPAAVGDHVYFGTENGTFFSVNWKQSQVDWKFRDGERGLPYRSSAAVAEGVVVVGSRSKKVYALNAETGDEVWSYATRGRIDSSPVIAGSRVYIGSSDGRLHVFDLKSGSVLHEYETGGGINGSPAIAAGRLIVRDRRRCGVLLWSQALMTSETKKTEVGSYFIANYPPFSTWKPEYLPEVRASVAIAAARHTLGAVPPYSVLSQALQVLLLPSLHGKKTPTKSKPIWPRSLEKSSWSANNRAWAAALSGSSISAEEPLRISAPSSSNRWSTGCAKMSIGTMPRR